MPKMTVRRTEVSQLAARRRIRKRREVSPSSRETPGWGRATTSPATYASATRASSPAAPAQECSISSLSFTSSDWISFVIYSLTKLFISF